MKSNEQPSIRPFMSNCHVTLPSAAQSPDTRNRLWLFLGGWLLLATGCGGGGGGDTTTNTPPPASGPPLVWNQGAWNQVTWN
jgi:hypothetical protein